MAKTTLVIVDDEKDILESYSEIFEDQYSVKTFLNVTDFLTYLGQHKPEDVPVDILITDYQIEKNRSGLDMVEAAYKMQFEIPFILMSGYLDKDTSIRANNLGAHRILEKPFEPHVLVTEVESLLLENQIQQIHKYSQNMSSKLKSLLRMFDTVVADLNGQNRANEIFKTLIAPDLPATMNYAEKGLSVYLQDLDRELHRSIKLEESLTKQLNAKLQQTGRGRKAA